MAARAQTPAARAVCVLVRHRATSKATAAGCTHHVLRNSSGFRSCDSQLLRGSSREHHSLLCACARRNSASVHCHSATPATYCSPRSAPQPETTPWRRGERSRDSQQQALELGVRHRSTPVAVGVQQAGARWSCRGTAGGRSCGVHLQTAASARNTIRSSAGIELRQRRALGADHGDVYCAHPIDSWLKVTCTFVWIILCIGCDHWFLLFVFCLDLCFLPLLVHIFGLLFTSLLDYYMMLACVLQMQ